MEEITIEEYKKAIKTSGNPGNKYGAVKSRCNKNHLHDSKAEAERCNELWLEFQSDFITHLRQQPKFVLLKGFTDREGNKVRGITYRADFVYYDADGIRVVEDVKGCLTGVYKLKKKMFLNKMKRSNTRFVEII